MQICCLKTFIILHLHAMQYIHHLHHHIYLPLIIQNKGVYKIQCSKMQTRDW